MADLFTLAQQNKTVHQHGNKTLLLQETTKIIECICYIVQGLSWSSASFWLQRVGCILWRFGRRYPNILEQRNINVVISHLRRATLEKASNVVGRTRVAETARRQTTKIKNDNMLNPTMNVHEKWDWACFEIILQLSDSKWRKSCF